ncbi:MAG: HAD-IIIA family hydrolase, partial [Actinomycetota bacterium]|nr:HAD-IIIA family hydrolase [Actinomycetota bacterium]
DSLSLLLSALAAQAGPPPGRVIVVDDRRVRGGRLVTPAAHAALGSRLRILEGPGRGPAAARNVGWHESQAEWIAFLDDDVLPPPEWASRFASDIRALPPHAAASQGGIVVPLPPDRPPTDRERGVAGLAGAQWATADMAYRRRVLEQVGGFDERFPRAYREDADLGLRVVSAGHQIVHGDRTVAHPVWPSGRLASVRAQAGNADDMAMLALHGRRWREAAGAPAGRRPRNLATTAAGLAALAVGLAGRRAVALTMAAGWGAGTAELMWSRIAPGPRTRDEVSTMVLTSLLIPPAATLNTVRGLMRLPHLLRSAGAAAKAPPRVPDAVLLDRDGTLVVDVPYNGDPSRVRPMPGAAEALDRLRAAGVRTAVVSNQSGIGRGLLTPQRVAAVNRRVEELLGPIGPWLHCPHHPDDGCSCRKPAPGLVLRAAEQLGAEPARCAVIGDIGADVEAARAAGARGILVPTHVTRPEEIVEAPEVVGSLPAAVDLLLGEAAA